MAGARDWQSKRDDKVDQSPARPSQRAGAGNLMRPRGRRQPMDNSDLGRQGNQPRGVGSLDLDLEGDDSVGRRAGVGSLGLGLEGASEGDATGAGSQRDAAAVRDSPGVWAGASALRRPEAGPVLPLPARLPADIADAIRTVVQTGEQQFQDSLAVALAGIVAGTERSLQYVHVSGIQNAVAIDDAHRRPRSRSWAQPGRHGARLAQGENIVVSWIAGRASQDGSTDRGATIEPATDQE